MFLVTFLRLSVPVIFLYSDMLNDWHHQKSVHFYRHYELMFVLKQFDQMLALSYQSQQQLHLLSPWLLVIFDDSFYLVLVFYLLFGFQHHSSYNVPPSLFFSMFFRTLLLIFHFSWFCVYHYIFCTLFHLFYSRAKRPA